ncbi:adenosine 5'-monophosphoramidase HINT3 [Drosophila sulfurigaster albostrigata]|uniref:adenosine 5'-monophosphoramidase HINT3 n=1 Tax=Drosophila sulfurigaster albostrigata TaxID=89887 RepID=UPI002D21E1A8|nr:adenosine 5'-monophosphoramidase HINT3 [Drosophila sulfurigaster albostrigata]
MSSSKRYGSCRNVWKKKKCILFSVLIFLIFVLFIKYTIETTTKSFNEQSPAKCLFCQIASGNRTPPVLEFENDEYVIFKDIRPASTHHYLAIPKKHYESLKVLNKSHVGLVSRMYSGMVDFLGSKGIDTSDAVIGFHIPPFISQHHLHLHGISPISEMGFWDRINFLTNSFWFKSGKDAIDSLERSEL